MSVFETSESSDPFSLWSNTPQTISFGLEEETSQVYRVNLPADLEASRQALAEQEARFTQLDGALDSVPSQLEELAARLKAVRPAGQSGVSFAVPDSEAESTPEGELLALLAESDAAARSGGGPGGGSFGLSEQLSEASREASSRFEVFLAQLEHEILHFAWVETKISNQSIARTEVGWGGDATTFWSISASDTEKALHQRTLGLTLRTRQVKMRLFATVASGAAKIATLTATGTPVLALPAVYQYVTRILAQAKELQAVQTPR
jgi:hypothetical protein